MKRKSKNKPDEFVSSYIGNRFVQLFSNNEFRELFSKHASLLRNESNRHNVKLKTICKSDIESFLIKKKVPLTWVKPIFNLIRNDEFDSPIQEGISIMVGPDEITSNTEGILIIRNNITGKSSHSDVSIKITSKVSIDRVIRFIRAHKKDIELWQERIELPEVSTSGYKGLNKAMTIAELKDNQGLSFYEIAEKFSTEPSMVHLADDSTIKTIYYRYKKLLESFKD